MEGFQSLTHMDFQLHSVPRSLISALITPHRISSLVCLCDSLWAWQDLGPGKACMEQLVPCEALSKPHSNSNCDLAVVFYSAFLVLHCG